jgi:hypothetical protein
MGGLSSPMPPGMGNRLNPAKLTSIGPLEMPQQLRELASPAPRIRPFSVMQELIYRSTRPYSRKPNRFHMPMYHGHVPCLMALPIPKRSFRRYLSF